MHSQRAYTNVLISIALAITALAAVFNTMAGTISLGQGIIITLLVIGLLALLNIHLRLEELAEDRLQ